MTILSGDLKILKSEIMSDAPESGGGMTHNVVVDGASNNIFDDISTLARTYGEVNLRKVFPAVLTQDEDRFYGAHLIISKLPTDQKLGVNLFKTNDYFDTRTHASSLIENYRGMGGLYNGTLLGKQYAGSQILTIFQSIAAEIPKINEVLLLQITATLYQQYIQVVQVASEIRAITISQGDHDVQINRRIVTLELSNPLEVDFVGADISQYDNLKPPALLYQSVVANAARYYSARPLKDAAALGDFSLMVDDIYSQVIPSSQSQTPLIDLSAGGKASPIIDSATGTTSFTLSTTLSANVSLYIGRAYSPNSLTIAYSGGVMADVDGELKSGGVSIGTCDHALGIVTFAANAPTIGDIKTITYRPAVAPLVISDTDSIAITDLNRSFVYVVNINPPPQPNALSVAFRALDNNYELRDNGAGALVGQVAGIGVGSIDYVTGTCAITLSSLPDVGSELIFSWGKAADFTPHTGATPSLVITKQLSHPAIAAASLVITWNDSGTTRTITSNAAGVLSGYGSGEVVAITGFVKFSPTTLPPTGTVFNFAYTYGEAAQITKTLTSFDMTGNHVTLNLGDTDIVTGSLAIEWAVPWGSSTLHSLPLNVYVELPIIPTGTVQQADRDNGAGALVGGRNSTVNYSTGIVTLDWAIALNLKFPTYYKGTTGAGAVVAQYQGMLTFPAEIGTTTSFIVHYRLTSAAISATDTLTLANPALKLMELGNDVLVPSSLLFSYAGKTYTDRLGQLYYGIDPATGIGTYGGTVDYATATAMLLSWTAGADNSGVVIAALSTADFAPVDRVTFRTDLAPIKPASFSLRATKISGGFITATANDSGVILTSDMDGTINVTTGIVKIKFGQWITAAGNEAEAWFNAENIRADGKIFHPKPVLASSIIYNAVSYTFIPLSSDILGLNPIRLPIDGRIPVYHKGDIVVVLNDQKTVGTFTTGATTDLARTRLAKCTVKDYGGNLLASTKWSVNLDTGIITWGDLAGVSQPLAITARIEDMAVVSDMQVTGKLTLSKPLTHNFPATSTLVANAVVYGDMYARASIPFDQQTWTNVWSDTLIGSSTSAQFDVNNYPIIITNLGTKQERWALVFTSATLFNVIGEHVGQIATGLSISNDVSPINPANGDPYFTLTHQGFGGGWSAGNVLRFNTYAAAAPVWIIQSVAQGEPTSSDYGCCLEFRGDINA
jgi:hypothetical protein